MIDSLRLLCLLSLTENGEFDLTSINISKFVVCI